MGEDIRWSFTELWNKGINSTVFSPTFTELSITSNFPRSWLVMGHKGSLILFFTVLLSGMPWHLHVYKNSKEYFYWIAKLRSIYLYKCGLQLKIDILLSKVHEVGWKQGSFTIETLNADKDWRYLTRTKSINNLIDWCRQAAGYLVQWTKKVALEDKTSLYWFFHVIL